MYFQTAVEKYIGKFRCQPANFIFSSLSYSRIESKGYNYPAKITLHRGKKINVNFFVAEEPGLNDSFLLTNKIIDIIRLASIPLHPDYQCQDLGYFGKKVECWCRVPKIVDLLLFTALHRQLSPPVLDHIGLFLKG